MIARGACAAATMADTTTTYTLDELAKHNTRDDLWVAVGGAEVKDTVVERMALQAAARRLRIREAHVGALALAHVRLAPFEELHFARVALATRG